MRMIIVGGVLMVALLVAVLTSIKADGPHWIPGTEQADRPLVGGLPVGSGAG